MVKLLLDQIDSETGGLICLLNIWHLCIILSMHSHHQFIGCALSYESCRTPLCRDLFSERPYGGARSFEAGGECPPCQNVHGRAVLPKYIAFTTGETREEDAIWDADGVGHLD